LKLKSGVRARQPKVVVSSSRKVRAPKGDGRFAQRVRLSMTHQNESESARETRCLDAQKFPVAISTRPHPIPSRTRKLSSSEPMVLQGELCGRVGRCRVNLKKGLRGIPLRPFAFLSVRASILPPRAELYHLAGARRVSQYILADARLVMRAGDLRIGAWRSRISRS
jgi:hypothetical protein